MSGGTQDPHLSDADAFFVAWEREPALRAPALVVQVLDGPIDPVRYQHQKDMAVRLIPRLTQRIVPTPGSTAPPRWVDDPTFDLANHVTYLHAPGDGSMRALLDWLPPHQMRAFDPGRPPWEELIISGFEGDKTVLVHKEHHSITDGVGGMELARALWDFEPAPELEALEPMREFVVPTTFERFVDGWKHELGVLKRFGGRNARRVRLGRQDPAWFKRRLTEELGAIRRLVETRETEPDSPLMRGRSAGAHFEVLRYDIATLKAGAKAVQGTLNDAFMAGIIGGMDRYHREHGVDCEQLRVTMVVNKRGVDDVTSGNHVTGAICQLALGEPDPIKRTGQVADVAQRLRYDRTWDLIPLMWAVFNRLPFAMGYGLDKPGMFGHDLTCSNLPGVPIPFWVAGAANEAMWALGPRVGSAANITLFTNNGVAGVGINTDPAAVPDPAFFAACIDEGLQEIIDVALR